MNYYNEWDPQAAAWLRELISQKLIPRGLVDERSITEVKAEDLRGFTQCHFFAGIGGWPLAFRLAGVAPTVPLWSGSPPCQPFSVAGAGNGRNDPRHLAPAFLNLVAECRPQYLFGEQVAAAVTKDQWADALLIELAEEGYACGFAVLPACSVGAPHKRERIFFGARGMANSDGDVYGRQEQGSDGAPESAEVGDGAHITKSWKSCGNGADVRRLGDDCRSPDPHHGFWSDADWLGCRDGKFRPVEPGAFPLANGIPARVGRLRGYGNAIVPQIAAEFITAFLGSVRDAAKSKGA